MVREQQEQVVESQAQQILVLVQGFEQQVQPLEPWQQVQALWHHQQ
jgi:hypothetical protein